MVVTLWASAELMAESDRFAALLQQAESAHRGWEAGETAHYAVLVSDLQR